MKSLQEEHMVLSIRQVVGAKEGAGKGPEFIEVVCCIDFTSFFFFFLNLLFISGEASKPKYIAT